MSNKLTASPTCDFADDVLLCSTSLGQMKRMMSDFKRSTKKVGLKIHPDETKILSNQGSNKRMEVTIDNIKVEALPARECAKHLGQTLMFEQQETTERKSRVRAAWASFTKYKQELTSRSYLLRHRLCLFNMVITPTLTYASGTRTLLQEHEKLIRSTQRKMLRLIVQTKRKYKKERHQKNKAFFIHDTDEEIDTAELKKKNGSNT